MAPLDGGMVLIGKKFSGYLHSKGYGLQIGGGRTRIRTRVFGLEGQSDIQTTLYVLNRCDGLLFKKVTID